MNRLTTNNYLDATEFFNNTDDSEWKINALELVNTTKKDRIEILANLERLGVTRSHDYILKYHRGAGDEMRSDLHDIALEMAFDNSMELKVLEDID